MCSTSGELCHQIKASNIHKEIHVTRGREQRTGITMTVNRRMWIKGSERRRAKKMAGEAAESTPGAVDAPWGVAGGGLEGWR